MGAFSCGLHLNAHDNLKIEVAVAHGQADDGRLIFWVSVNELNIFCNSLASAEGIAEAIRRAIDAPREYAPPSEQAREANGQ